MPDFGFGPLGDTTGPFAAFVNAQADPGKPGSNLSRTGGGFDDGPHLLNRPVSRTASTQRDRHTPGNVTRVPGLNVLLTAFCCTIGRVMMAVSGATRALRVFSEWQDSSLHPLVLNAVHDF